MNTMTYDHTEMERNRERNNQLAREGFMRATRSPAPRLATSPIHWEKYDDQHVKVVDVRTLPEDVKVGIIQAALHVAFRYNNGQLDVIEEDPETDRALNDLACAVGRVTSHMHEINPVPLP